jgi:dienelactone hydrolase
MNVMSIACVIMILWTLGFSHPARDGKEHKFADVNPRIEIVRQSELVDAEVSLRVKNLAPGQIYTILLETRDDMGREWVSHADFLAGEDGLIDSSLQKPIAGSYSRVDSTGLFWAMTLKKPVKAPFNMFAKMSTRPQQLKLTISHEGTAIAAEEFLMKYAADDVKLIEVREEFVGKYFAKEGERSLPAVIVTGGSGGGFLWSEQVAALLASRGYAALAVAYFDYRGSYGLPNGLAEIPLEYFQDAARWLRGRKEVDPDSVSFIGISKGGELAMLIGSVFNKAFKAIVGFAPSMYVFEGIRVGQEEKVSSWSYEGKHLPFLVYPPEYEPSWNFDKSKLREFHEWAVKNATDEELEKARIKVENINCPVLLISGDKDSLGPTSEWSDAMMKRITEKKPQLKVRHLNYESAGHAFFIPNLPPSLITPRVQARDMAFAEKDAWAKMLQFLARHTK